MDYSRAEMTFYPTSVFVAYELENASKDQECNIVQLMWNENVYTYVQEAIFL